MSAQGHISARSPENAPFPLLAAPPTSQVLHFWQELRALVLGAGFFLRATSSKMHERQCLAFLDRIHASSVENALTC